MTHMTTQEWLGKLEHLRVLLAAEDKLDRTALSVEQVAVRLLVQWAAEQQRELVAVEAQIHARLEVTSPSLEASASTSNPT